MNQKIVSIAFVLLAIFFLTHTKVVQAATGLNIGDTAPNFTLKDLSGKKVQLSDFKGKSVMINFWATWCPPCKKEMLDIETFSKEYKDQWVVLAVNVDGGNEEGVRQFIQERKLTFPVIMDEKDVVANQYHILSIPTTYFLNKDGVIINKAYTMLTFEQMRELAQSKKE
ncbi:redoxin domain-containing protein [Cytobacillus oceanisediminis]|uniref:Redoxin domain-containing protein n=1 Tax=Niallia alba TaxID=2729105 RepID=A0A7Y0K8M1_9BACI|nr:MULTISPECIES: redoxin domain-containing protein [Bacillaceae]MBQ6446207.1 redoxin domain-containing protein [Bacillus sp. (in: firmicutes)]MBZ9535143.1 redoxin domain-containing protein [Cytobacillus oceanisediminis]NMO77740.1 redoxin domain-containing protein [Niallia alba]UTI40894.1 redoxin domain-containing protein [Niallia sp. RD1]